VARFLNDEFAMITGSSWLRLGPGVSRPEVTVAVDRSR
jgi:hypothetical protein